MDGGTRVAEVLKAHGVPFLFTLCGGHISPILAGCKRLGIRVIDVRDEKNAVFAADAVGRLTGIPGVAAVTAGPGVTNTITAIKNAQMAQSPLVVIGGATATLLRGRGSLQDIDQMALIKPHVKWAARPNTLRDVIPAMEKAFEVASSGVPGPVFVELAVDLLYEEEIVRDWHKQYTEREAHNLSQRVESTYIKLHLRNQFGMDRNPTVHAPRVPNIPEHSAKQVREAAKLLSNAERPVMVLGSQATLRPDEIDRLAKAIERLGIPVYLSGMARGLLGKGHELQMRHKRRMALKEADVVLLAGVPNDFRLDYGAHVSRATVISVNRDKKDLRKNRRPELGVLADPHRFLVAVADATESRSRPDWMQTLRSRNNARDEEIRAMADEETEFCNPLKVCLGIEEALSEDSIIVVDGGDFVASASYVASPRGPMSWLDPGVFGTLGVGAGFALGAKLVRPEADVWLLYGDGSAGFSMQEFDTFVRHGLPIIAVIGNDAGWTQIQRDQVQILKDDVGTVLRHTDYHKVAEGWGGKGFMLKSESAIKTTFTKAVKASHEGQPVCVNALIGATKFREGSMSM